jgi:L-xylulokinase
MSELVVGIDSGLTMTKAVVFDAQGKPLGTGSGPSEQKFPNEGWVEKDPVEQWNGAAQAVRRALDEAKVDASDIAAVGTTGHGDGLYTLDADGNPARAAILSLDGRAGGLSGRLTREVGDRVLQLSGNPTAPFLPGVLLRWLKENEPDSYERVATIFYCKDWLKYRLTGRVSTDPTEASAGFTNADTQRFDPELMDAFGVSDKFDALPEIIGSYEVAGEVTREAAEATGLAAGTPVVSGLHDCTASAAGSGGVRPGQLTMIAGTFSINEVITDAPVRDQRVFCRNWVESGQYMNMGNSAASATNLEWFVNQLAAVEAEQARKAGKSPYAFAGEEVAGVAGDPSRILYLPFLYGSPDRPDATAVFFGLKAWHTRGHLLRALFEGVAFNHRTHVDALRDHAEVSEARLTGGGARSEAWVQIFADALGVPVSVTDAGEAGALGTAICAGVAAGIHGSVAEVADQAVHVTRTFEPDPARQAELEDVYGRYQHLVETLDPAFEKATLSAEGNQ